MKIYDRNGTQITKSEVLTNLPITPKCEHVEELMRDDYVSLNWNDAVRYTLPVGAYIIPYPNDTNGGDSRYPLKYRLFDDYVPEKGRDESYNYEPQFQHPIMWLTKLPMLLITGNIRSWGDAIKRTTWSYAGSAKHIAGFIVDEINWLAANYPGFGEVFGSGWTAVVDDDLVTTATIKFDSVDIYGGAAQIAQAFDCEFHFDFERKQFRLGIICYDGYVELKTGVSVGVAEVTRSKQDYYNAFLVKGSTKNLSQPNDAGESTQVLERLTLDPTKYPDSIMYTDGNGNIITREQFLALNIPMLLDEMVFDDIYPKLELYLYDVRERKCWLLDENGNRTEDPEGELDPDDGKRYKSYSKWYTRLAYPVYNGGTSVSSWLDYKATEDKIIDGQTLQMTFILNTNPGAKESLLIGQGDFDMVYFSKDTVEKKEDDISPEGFTAHEGDYRIIFHQTDDIIIPTTSKGGMYPLANSTPSLVNNMVTMLNVVVDDVHKRQAREDLEKASKRKIKILCSDLNNYVLPSDPIYFEEHSPNIHIGSGVIYNDGQDLAGGTSYILKTYIRKIVRQLDFPFVLEITIGNENIKSKYDLLAERIAAMEGIDNTRQTRSIEYQKQYLMVFCDQRGYPYNSVIPAHPGYVNIPLFPKIYYGEDDITATATAWQWRKYLPDGSEDTGWSAQHTERDITLTDLDMPTAWGRVNSVVFECIATLDADTEIAKTINFG